MSELSFDEKLSEILERVQLYAKDHPMQVTGGDRQDKEDAKEAIKQLILSDLVGEAPVWKNTYTHEETIEYEGLSKAWHEQYKTINGKENKQ